LEGDFVLVQYDVHGKKKRNFYIGEVTCSKDNNNYEVNSLRRSNTLEGKFIKPETEDRASVHEKPKNMIPPKPSFCGQTKRQKS
jgi:hypothetical protein